MGDPRVRTLLDHGRRIATRASDEAYFATACFRAGIFGIEPPGRLAQMALLLERYGLLSASLGISALRNGNRVVMHDELGVITYRALDEETNALANAWREQGVRAGDGIAILVRNHRGFMQALFAAAKLGAKIILLNTSFAGPQIREVAQREGTDMLVVDDEYISMLDGIEPPRGRWRAWVDEPVQRGAPDTLAALIAAGSRAVRPSPSAAPEW